MTSSPAFLAPAAPGSFSRTSLIPGTAATTHRAVRPYFRCRPRAQLADPATTAVDELKSPPAPIWSRAPVPVYSVCTSSSELGRGNMNIATYVTPCGLGSSPKFALALYVGTLTWVNVKQLGRARLSMLSKKHLPLVTLFGKASGRVIDKPAEALTMGFEIDHTDDNTPFIKDGPGYVDLRVESWVDCGDHELAICSTIRSKELMSSSSGDGADAVMTTGFLRERGMMPAL